MKSQKFSLKLGLLISIVLLLSASSLYALDLAATWNGGGDGSSYGDYNNWDIDVVPCNVGELYFMVAIPDGYTVNYTTSSCSVTQLELGNNSRINILSGGQYDIVGTANLYGIISADNSNFTAIGGGASFPGNRARVWGSNGAQVSISAPTYSSTGLWDLSGSSAHTWTLMSATGAETILDLSSIQSIDAGFNDGQNTSYDNGERNYHIIGASDGGMIDLSGLDTVTAPVQNDDYVRFNLSGATSTIDLSSLSTITSASRGRVIFDVTQGATLSLPSVETVFNGIFYASGGSRLNVNSSLATYSSTGLWDLQGSSAHTWTLMSATGAETILDLSSIQSIDAGFNDGQNTSYDNGERNYHIIGASDGGMIDLSGLDTVTAPAQDDDYFQFILSGETSAIDLSSLTTIRSAGSGKTLFTVNGGLLTLGELNPSGPTEITVTGVEFVQTTAILNVVGDVLLENPDKVTLSCATMEVKGDLEYRLIDENNFIASDSIIHMNGNGVQYLEAGGLNVGTMVSVLSNDNFGFGQLIVGQDDQPATVVLKDTMDNGNGYACAAENEAVYLFGLDAIDPYGLRILGGSTLVLNDINLYVYEDGVWVDINELFTSGVEEIAYDQGYIRVGGNPCMCDLNSDGACNVFDWYFFIEDWGMTGCNNPGIDCECDLNGDGSCNVFDWSCFIEDWGRMDCPIP